MSNLARAACTLGLTLLTTMAAWAGGHTCDRCGSCQDVCAVVHTVWTRVLVEEVVWDYVAEEVALPTRQCVAKHAGQPGGCVSCPSRPRNKLMRKTCVREVPVAKCIVEYLCCNCRNPAASPAAPLSPAPNTVPDSPLPPVGAPIPDPR